ncbi:MAG: L-lactate permease [Ardenticatenia bacterium]|nr:L-lactate permease [Ardenticatenia bacterium]
MQAMQTTWLDSVLASVPIVLVLVLMAWARWSAFRAGVAGWAVALVVAVWRFGAGVDLVVVSQVRALFLSLFVLYIIWPALLLHHVVDEAGAVKAISVHVAHLTRDRLVQFLLLAWAFASFLQGVTGFGVPTAVAAPLLMGLGFTPTAAVVGTTLAHGWAVTFGSVASSFYALLAVTGVSAELLAGPSALVLGVACVGCGAVAAHVAGGWRGVARGLLFILVVGGVMGAVQYGMAVAGVWNLSAFGGGLAGLVVGSGLAAWGPFRGSGDPPDGRPAMPLRWATAAYVILLAIFVTVALVPGLQERLNRVQITVNLPAVATARGWSVAAGPARPISLFGHAGALITLAALCSALLYARRGAYAPGAVGRVGRRVWRGGVRSTTGILAMVGMALLLDHSGMTFTLARGLADVVGAYLPAVAPFIGAVGAFMTGSNTNSNVVFGPLQVQMARLLGFNVATILAAQTGGGALGSSLAPAKLIVGVSTTSLAGEEGHVFRAALGYGVLLIALVALVATVMAWFG